MPASRTESIVVREPERQPLMRTHRYKRGRSWRPPSSSASQSLPASSVLIEMVKIGIDRARLVYTKSCEATLAQKLEANRDLIAKRLHDARRRSRDACNMHPEENRKLGTVARVRIRFEGALPKGNIYVSVKRNFLKPDDKKLRFIPYFGEDDDLPLNHEAYDSSEETESDMDDETRYIVRDVIETHGDGDDVVDAVAHVLSINRKDIFDLLGIAAENNDNAVADDRGALDTFETLFCRRCYVFNCNLHPVYQPTLRRRRLSIKENQPLDVVETMTPSAPCSASCYLSALDAAMQQPALFSDEEVELIQKLLVVCGDDWCALARMLDGNRTCADIAALSSQFSNLRLVKPLGKRLPTDVAKPARLTLTQLQRRSGSKLHQYEPCDHEGSCTNAPDCSCLNNGNFCDKFCACDRSCRRRFGGCKCASVKDRCATKRCPCFAASRECDADLCGICGMGDACGNCGISSYVKKAPLFLAPSDVHGWGAFAGRDIQKGELITEYVGEFISQEEADRRGQTYDKRDCSYLFDVNAEFCVDACIKGNKIKFANHSDNPNCYARIMYSRGDHRIGIFAKHDIKRGEEINFNYNHKSGSGAPKWFSNYS